MVPVKLTQEIERWMREGKYGHLQVNFANGKIVNVNKFESIRIDVTISQANTTFNETGAHSPDTNNGR